MTADGSDPRPRRFVRRLVILATCVLLASALAADADRVWQWDGVPRVVAFGDVHGAYDAVESLLRSTGVIDEEDRWVGGETHVVSLGDVVDRGPDSRRVLDLFMRLEQEAGRAGGAFHMLLGNHEVMNLVGDLRHVSREEFAAFASEEPEPARDAAWERFLNAREVDGETSVLRAEFDDRYPPGFFGFLDAFSSDGTYGRWLLDRLTVARVNETAFIHAGLSPIVAELGGAELNRLVTEQLRDYLAVIGGLERLGVLAPENSYADRDAVLRRALAMSSGQGTDEQLRALAERYAATSAYMAFLQDGPLWYRGTAAHSEEVERPILYSGLAALNADRVVLGHTPTPDARILPRFDGRVLLIDTGMLSAVYRGRASALILEAGDATAFYPDDGTSVELAAPTAASAAAMPAEDAMTDEELEDFLATAEIVEVEEVGTGVTRPLRVTLLKGDTRLRAVFKSGDTFTGRVSDPRSLSSINLTDRWTYDVAAYRLDRMLGMGMVPVAIRRTVEGKDGALQVWVEDAIDEKDRREQGLGPADPARLEGQLATMYTFDVLIYNEDRHAGNMLYTRPDWTLHLIDHSRSFRTKSSRPDALRKVDLAPPPTLVDAMRVLDKKELREVMDDLLHPVQITAMLKRRDRILKDLP
jgi:hypothetical protein